MAKKKIKMHQLIDNFKKFKLKNIPSTHCFVTYLLCNFSKLFLKQNHKEIFIIKIPLTHFPFTNVFNNRNFIGLYP